MPSIVIREIDETSAGEASSSTDVVYIPGFADTNSNCYVYATTGTSPLESTPGVVYTPTDTYNKHGGTGNYPSIAVNIADKKVWHCTEATSGGTPTYTWTLQDDYAEPHPENEPTLCTTVDEFESYFGKAPYQFTSAQAYPGAWGTNAGVTGKYIYEAGEYERSYIYAKELVRMGLPVLYENIVSRTDGLKGAPAVGILYTQLSDSLDNLEDKGEYTVKYITSGAYPTFEYTTAELAQKMITCAANRGDAAAFIDHTNNPSRKLDPTDTTSVYYCVKDKDFTNAEFGTMFTPWAPYTCTNAPTGAQSQVMPATFGYMLALAKSIKVNPNWLSIAGVARGQVPYIQSLNTVERLSNKIADAYQPRNDIEINAITNIKPYGLTIWGDGTLKNNAEDGNLTATSFLSIRNLVSDVKKVAYDAAKKLLFEQDSNILWLNFKSAITPLLDKMQTGYGISGYKIIRGKTTEKAKVVAIIRLFPMYPVRDFDITVVMSDDEVSVS